MVTAELRDSGFNVTVRWLGLRSFATALDHSAIWQSGCRD